jgi:hypothetical protein
LEKRAIVKKYSGPNQSADVIKSTCGREIKLSSSPAAEVFVSPSKQKKEMIKNLFDRYDNLRLYPAMFASHGSDATVRIWQPKTEGFEEEHGDSGQGSGVFYLVDTHIRPVTTV